MRIAQAPGTPVTEEMFWAFSLELYGKPGFSKACLALQDKNGADVNVLLLLLLAASEAYAVDLEGLTAALDQTLPWRKDVVSFLRAARRSMKAQGSSTPHEGYEELLICTQDIELRAERIAQSLLLQKLPLSPSSLAADILAQKNIMVYVTSFLVSDSMMEEEVGVLLDGFRGFLMEKRSSPLE